MCSSAALQRSAPCVAHAAGRRVLEPRVVKRGSTPAVSSPSSCNPKAFAPVAKPVLTCMIVPLRPCAPSCVLPCLLGCSPALLLYSLQL